MPSLLSRYRHDTYARKTLTLPLALLASLVTYLGNPVKHSLLTSAIAWVSICTYCTLKSGSRSLIDVTPAKGLAWAAGLLFALAQVCERAVDGSGIWWAKVLIPLVIYGANGADLFKDVAKNPAGAPTAPEQASGAPVPGSKSLLVILTTSALAVVHVSSGSNTATALGLSCSVLSALAFSLVQRVHHQTQHVHDNGGSVIYSANAFLTQPSQPTKDAADVSAATIRDISASAAVASVFAAVALESWSFGGLTYWGLIGQGIGDRWMFGQGVLTFVYALGMIVANVAMSGTLLLTIQRQGDFLASFIPLSAAVSAQLILSFSLSRAWFAVLCATSAFLFLDEQGTFAAGSKNRMRLKRLLPLVALGSFAVLAVLHLRQPFQVPRFSSGSASAPVGSSPYAPAPEPLAPLQYTSTRVHPVDQLVRDAEASWMATLDAQSQNLEAAVAEYRRRYSIPPPPNFDKWYEFAKLKGVKLIDEYDTIHHSLLPFWALSPATTRARVREALGFGSNNLIGLMIRDGKAVHVEGGQEWQQQATVGMMEQFVQYLPDMDLAFNVHDEPRVVVPHDELSRLVKIASSESMPAAFANPVPKNTFSARPKDLNNGKRIAEVKVTKFNVLAHQPVWIPSRLSCSPDSPARALDGSLTADNLTAYAVGELGFVYNHTAFSDVCHSPSFATSHGFFDRPNAFNVIHELFPIFSQSKMSSFQDILYPSPWYWYGKVAYNEGKDLDWRAKESRLWWRGSTTGGFSRDGGWKRQHRQQFVRKMNSLDQAKILTNSRKGEDTVQEWKTKEVPRQDYKEIMDVHFSDVGQCDPGDCDAQREFFDIVPSVDQQDAWKYRYLLDIDGNAFSGRFYAFLKSRSLTLKMAVFREWHEEWIKPWVHYIPLSLRGDEALEAVRYLSAEEEGKQQAVRMAEVGREWAGKALRNEDFEAWFFRLLLEYGRIVDDNRAVIGYAGS